MASYGARIAISRTRHSHEACGFRLLIRVPCVMQRGISPYAQVGCCESPLRMFEVSASVGDFGVLAQAALKDAARAARSKGNGRFMRPSPGSWFCISEGCR